MVNLEVKSCKALKFFMFTYQVVIPLSCKFCMFLQDTMLVCDACDKGFHMNCHEPAVEKKPQGKNLILNLYTLFILLGNCPS